MRKPEKGVEERPPPSRGPLLSALVGGASIISISIGIDLPTEIPYVPAMRLDTCGPGTEPWQPGQELQRRPSLEGRLLLPERRLRGHTSVERLVGTL